MNNLSSWEGFTGTQFLKAEMVADDKTPFSVIEVEFDQENSRPRVILQKTGNPDNDYLFDLNVTNSTFLKEAGIPAPAQLKGKRIYFKKVLVRNPTTKKEQEGLRICKVE